MRMSLKMCSKLLIFAETGYVEHRKTFFGGEKDPFKNYEFRLTFIGVSFFSYYVHKCAHDRLWKIVRE